MMWGRPKTSTTNLKIIRLCRLQISMWFRTEMLPPSNLASTSHSHSAAFLLPPQIWVCEFTLRFWRFQFRGCIHDKILAACKYHCRFLLRFHRLEISTRNITLDSPPNPHLTSHWTLPPPNVIANSHWGFANPKLKFCHSQISMQLQTVISPSISLIAHSHCVYITVEFTMSYRCL